MAHISVILRIIIGLATGLTGACSSVPSPSPPAVPVPETITAQDNAGLPTITEFIKGSDIGSGFDLTVGPDGNLYVATLDGREIVVLDPDTSHVVRRYGPNDGVDKPISVAVGTDGDIFWLNASLGQAGRLTPDGEFDERVIGHGITALMFAPDGRLLVARSFAGRNELYALPPDFSDLQFARRIDAISGSDIGPDGMLYGAVRFSGEITRYDLKNTETTSEVVAEGLAYPTDVEFDREGQLYAVAALGPQTSAVFRIDPEDGNHTIVAEHPTGLHALAFDDENRMFVSDVVDATVYEVMADGTLRALRPGGHSAVGGLAILPRADGDESLFAVDLWGGLREFDTVTGEQLSHVPNSPYPATPVAALVLGDIDGRLVLASAKSREVQIWDPKTQQEISRAPFSGLYPGDIVAYNGSLVIPTYPGVNRFDPADLGERETISRLARDGVAVIGNNLYVGDFYDGTVMQIIEKGEMLQEPRLVVRGLEGPEGMALAPDGRLLVVESAAGRLSAVDLMTGEVETVVEGLDFVQPQEVVYADPPFWVFNDIALDSNGYAYVSGDGAHVIYKITLPGNSSP